MINTIIYVSDESQERNSTYDLANSTLQMVLSGTVVQL